MLSASISLPGHTLAQCEAPATRVGQQMVNWRYPPTVLRVNIAQGASLGGVVLAPAISMEKVTRWERLFCLNLRSERSAKEEVFCVNWRPRCKLRHSTH